MKIYLLLIDDARFFFYSDESEASDDKDHSDDSSGPRRSGVRGWVLAKYDRFRSAWEHADSGALHWMRLSWDWLHSWTHPDEAMLARLWSARRVELHHPASRRGDLVRAIWMDYLRQQWRRHLVWLIVNAVIAPISVLFAILPGPNLIGYWFAYRAIHHSLVVWGIRRVRRDKIPTELHPTRVARPASRNWEGRQARTRRTRRPRDGARHAYGVARLAAPAESKPAVVPAANGLEPAELQSDKSKDP